MFPKSLLLIINKTSKIINKTSKPQPELYLDFHFNFSPGPIFLLDQFPTILSPRCIQVVNLDNPRSWKLAPLRTAQTEPRLFVVLSADSVTAQHLTAATRLFQGTAAPTTSIKGSPWSAFHSTEPLTNGQAAPAQKGPWHQLMDNWVITPYKPGIAFHCRAWLLSQGTVVLPLQGMDLMINRLSSSLTTAVLIMILSFLWGSLSTSQTVIKASSPGAYLGKSWTLTQGREKLRAHSSFEDDSLQPSHFTAAGPASSHTGLHALYQLTAPDSTVKTDLGGLRPLSRAWFPHSFVCSHCGPCIGSC